MLKITESLQDKTIKSVYVPLDHTKNDISHNEINEVMFDSMSIIIEFIDGTKLGIWNSEWGGMKVIN